MATKKNYTPEQMGSALDAVRMGEKISTAALRFGVPRITLHNKVTGKKNHTQIIEKEVNPKQIEFVKYLEAEIVAVYSRQKLDLFHALYLKDRSTVEQNIPSEDESLFVIWAKNKQELFNSERSIPQIDSVENQLSTSEAAPDNTESEVQHPNSTAILTTEASLLLESQKKSSLKPLECTGIDPCRHSLALTTISKLPDQMEEPRHEQTNRISVKNQALFCSTPPTQTQSFLINRAFENQIPEFVRRTNNTESPSATPKSASETTATSWKEYYRKKEIVVPSPFEPAPFFWPEKPKEKITEKEKLPFEVTSTSWKEFYRNKEMWCQPLFRPALLFEEPKEKITKKEKLPFEVTSTSWKEFYRNKEMWCQPLFRPALLFEEPKEKITKKEKLPFEVTSTSWKEYYRNKEMWCQPLFRPALLFEEPKEKITKKEKLPFEVTSTSWKEYYRKKEIVVPSPFFGPKNRRKKLRKKRSYLSYSWQEYYRKKEIEKQNLQQEKERRALERQHKKVLKVKNIAEKKGKSKSKPKSKHREYTTSSKDTDADIVYAESDDPSVLSNPDKSREKPHGPQPSKRRKISFTKQGTKSSKRPRKNLKCNKSDTDSDDEP